MRRMTLATTPSVVWGPRLLGSWCSSASMSSADGPLALPDVCCDGFFLQHAVLVGISHPSDDEPGGVLNRLNGTQGQEFSFL